MFNEVEFNHKSVFLFLFCSYVLLSFLKVVNGSDNFFYLLVPTFLCLLIIPLFIRREISITALILLFFAIFFGGILFFTKTDNIGGLYPLFMCVFIVLFIFYAKYYPDFKFLWCANACYLIYLTASVLSFFMLSSYYRVFQSEFGNLFVFHGVEGTPASIDSFSVFVFLSNVFYNHSKLRWVMYFLTLSTIVMVGATTPILIFLVVFLSYLFLKTLRSFSLLVTLFFIVLFSIFYLSITNETANGFILVATNGRNIIWDQQILNLGWYNLFLGDVASSIVSIPWSTGTTINPHNMFLFIVLRLGFAFLLLLVLIMIMKGREQEDSKKLLLMAFLAGGISNTNLFYITNPFYLYMLCFCLTTGEDSPAYHKNIPSRPRRNAELYK